MNSPENLQMLVDWGTSNVRAWLTDGTGSILAENKSDMGITRVPDNDFASVYEDIKKGLSPEISGFDPPTLMSGMIGSRQGWVEAPYLECPVTLDNLAGQLIQVPGLSHINIVPGVHYQSPEGSHDVMRGEEVQISGALELAESARNQGLLVCLPGTHSKWAVVEDNKLVGFSTAMTGEAFAALSDHTILAALFEDPEDDTIMASGFAKGIDRSGEPGGLLNHLFGVRANGLLGAVPNAKLRSYLSGILIGHEVRSALAQETNGTSIVIVGDDALAGLYQTALQSCGKQADIIPSTRATIQGLQRILKQKN